MKPIYRDLIVLVIVALLGGVIGWIIKPCNCPELSSVKIEYRDSIIQVTDTVEKPIFNNTLPKKYFSVKSNIPFDTSNVINLYASCQDTNYYSKDTTVADNYKASAKVVVTGNELSKFEIKYVSLVPEKITIKEVTNTIVEKKQSLVKVYTGIYAGVSIANKTVASYHGGVGLDAIISDRHLIGFQGGLNSSLQPEFGVRFSEKIRLKK